jgi:hypothetical protein
MIEVSGSESIPLTIGSGSRRPKTYGSDGSGSATLLTKVDRCIVAQSPTYRYLLYESEFLNNLYEQSTLILNPAFRDYNQI